MKKQKIFYKVVQNCNPMNRRYYSVNNLPAWTPYMCHYVKGKWTYPKIGKLFVFDHLQRAQEFPPFLDGSLLIFRCVVKKPIEAKLMSASAEYVSCFWNDTSPRTPTEIPPLGTYFVDAVKIYGDEVK